jgi:hypothetical protein
MNIKEYLHDSLHATQWGANLMGWWHERITNHRSRKDLIAYHTEATDKVWFMRTQPSDISDIETKRQAAIEQIQTIYNDIPEEGYTDWECGYWNGVMATLRWVLGDDEKNNLDT